MPINPNYGLLGLDWRQKQRPFEILGGALGQGLLSGMEGARENQRQVALMRLSDAMAKAREGRAREAENDPRELWWKAFALTGDADEADALMRRRAGGSESAGGTVASVTPSAASFVPATIPTARPPRAPMMRPDMSTARFPGMIPLDFPEEIARTIEQPTTPPQMDIRKAGLNPLLEGLGLPLSTPTRLVLEPSRTDARPNVQSLARKKADEDMQRKRESVALQRQRLQHDVGIATDRIALMREAAASRDTVAMRRELLATRQELSRMARDADASMATPEQRQSASAISNALENEAARLEAKILGADGESGATGSGLDAQTQGDIDALLARDPNVTAAALAAGFRDAGIQVDGQLIAEYLQSKRSAARRIAAVGGAVR